MPNKTGERKHTKIAVYRADDGLIGTQGFVPQSLWEVF
jgi:hypothetical protein